MLQGSRLIQNRKQVWIYCLMLPMVNIEGADLAGKVSWGFSNKKLKWKIKTFMELYIASQTAQLIFFNLQ